MKYQLFSGKRIKKVSLLKHNLKQILLKISGPIISVACISNKGYYNGCRVL